MVGTHKLRGLNSTPLAGEELSNGLAGTLAGERRQRPGEFLDEGIDSGHLHEAVVANRFADLAQDAREIVVLRVGRAGPGDHRLVDFTELGQLDVVLLEGVAQLVGIAQVEQPAGKDEGRGLEDLLAFAQLERPFDRKEQPLKPCW